MSRQRSLDIWAETETRLAAHVRPSVDARMENWLYDRALEDVELDEVEDYVEDLRGTHRAAAARVGYALDDLIYRVLERADSWLYRVEAAIRRSIGRPFPERTPSIVFTIHPDVSTLTSAFRAATVSAEEAGARMKDMLTAFGQAASSFDRLPDSDPVDLLALARRAQQARRDQAWVRTIADVHRYELSRWFDDHADTVWADLGLERPKTNGRAA